MRRTLSLLLILAAGLGGCASDMKGKWPSLATRPGEVTPDLPGGAAAICARCAPDVVAAPVVVPPAPAPLPADTESRLASIAAVIAGVEAKAPAQARTATAAINAARRNPGLSGDAEVERSRYESLFLPLSLEERRLEVLSDDVAGRDGADAVLVKVEALRMRLDALQRARGSLPD